MQNENRSSAAASACSSAPERGRGWMSPHLSENMEDMPSFEVDSGPKFVGIQFCQEWSVVLHSNIHILWYCIHVCPIIVTTCFIQKKIKIGKCYCMLWVWIMYIYSNDITHTLTHRHVTPIVCIIGCSYHSSWLPKPGMQAT